MRGRPLYISAGESHSACVTDRFTLYTWGSGQYGRLGHGFDTDEHVPKAVEGVEAVQVTCGAFHTLAVTRGGGVVGFGQGRYGKIGVNRADKDKAYMLPEQVTMFKIDSGDLLP
jgi:alpha-tubulin suppressor-like RCC1 family protein